ncbi:hypothetical protein [Actinomadura vinacea]|uniref:hypothetical protein n=1 Tax=Actinomadura vinacea TaxID=115336 RepID=UPI0031D799A4
MQSVGVVPFGVGERAVVADMGGGAVWPAAEKERADAIAGSELDAGVQRVGGVFGHGGDEQDGGERFGGVGSAEAGQVGFLGVLQEAGAADDSASRWVMAALRVGGTTSPGRAMASSGMSVSGNRVWASGEAMRSSTRSARALARSSVAIARSVPTAPSPSRPSPSPGSGRVMAPSGPVPRVIWLGMGSSRSA